MNDRILPVNEECEKEPAIDIADRETLRDLAELALVREMLDDQRAHQAFLDGRVTIVKP